MNRKIMEAYVTVSKEKNIIAPFDWMYQHGYVGNDLFKRYSICPMIISQKPGFSQVDNVRFGGLSRSVKVKKPLRGKRW